MIEKTLLDWICNKVEVEDILLGIVRKHRPSLTERDKRVRPESAGGGELDELKPQPGEKTNINVTIKIFVV